MVTQEGVASSNEPQQPDRRGMTAAAIRRGDVKISEPLMQSYASPHPTASQRRLQLAASSSRTQLALSQRKSDEALDAHLEVADGEEQRPQSFESTPRSPVLRHKRASLTMREDSVTQSITTPATHSMKRDSGITDSPASSGSQLQSRKKRRSGTGTFKGVFRRLFSKRDKESPPRHTEAKKAGSPGSRQHGYHRSDPLPKSTEQSGKGQHFDSKNPSVQPPPPSAANKYSPSTPVPQRLPFPMNVNAPQPESPGEHYTSFNSPYVHRRRATLPSVIVSAQDASALQKYWAADAHIASPSENSVSHRTPSPMIGLALSSGANIKRRSRSAGALYDMAKEDQAEQRRRSAEIQYWRQSYQPQEPEIVTLEQQPQFKQSLERLSEQGSIISEHHSGTEISAALADAGSSIRDEPAIQSITTYDFAPVVPPSREMEPSAQPVSDEKDGDESTPAGGALDQRLSQLEEHMRTLTSSIHDLTGRAHRQTVILESAPRRSHDRVERLSHSQSSPAMQRAPEPASGPGLSVRPQDNWSGRRQSRHFQQPSPPSSGASTASVQKTVRAPSNEVGYLFPSGPGVSPTITGRPITYQQESHFISPESINFESVEYQQYGSQHDTFIGPSLPSPSIYTHLAPLYSALRYERSQRKAMETKIAQLTEQMTHLAAIVTTMHETSTVAGRAVPAWKQKSRFSGYDDSDNGDAGVAEGEGDQDATPMVTPQEEWATPAQNWPARSASAELGSPIEGEMF